MPEKVKRFYWDSDCFIKVISNLMTPEAVEARSNLELFFQDAIDGRAQIFTSTVTITEVIRVEAFGIPPVTTPSDVRQKIVDLFEEPYITPIPLDPARAIEARALRWQYTRLKTMDAIQIASAVFAKVDVMHTYDGSGNKPGILSLDGLVGNPPLKIQVPRYTGGHQSSLIPPIS